MSAAYQLYHRGILEGVRFGRTIRILRAPLYRKLRLNPDGTPEAEVPETQLEQDILRGDTDPPAGEDLKHEDTPGRFVSREEVFGRDGTPEQDARDRDVRDLQEGN